MLVAKTATTVKITIVISNEWKLENTVKTHKKANAKHNSFNLYSTLYNFKDIIVLTAKNTTYESPVEMAAPLAPYIGTKTVFPARLQIADIPATTIWAFVFFLKLIPITVVSEMVYIIGINVKKGNIYIAFLY